MSSKTLSTLIKVHKQQTDMLRREMVQLETELHQLEKASEQLQYEHEQEMRMVIRAPEFSGFFGAYSAHVQQRQKAIVEEVRRLNEAIEEKRVAIAEEFSEQKKYEIAQENMKKRQQEEEKHRQQSRFDEVANQQYLAKHKEN